MRWTVLSGGAAWVAAAGILAACAVGGPTEQRVAMAPISFGEIAGWGEDKQSEALAAFRRSCPKLVAGPDTKIATDGGTKTICGMRATMRSEVVSSSNCSHGRRCATAL